MAKFNPSKLSEGENIPIEETINIEPFYFDYRGDGQVLGRRFLQEMAHYHILIGAIPPDTDKTYRVDILLGNNESSEDENNQNEVEAISKFYNMFKDFNFML